MEHRTASRAYRNHHIDSHRWEGYEPRGDDVIIATPTKAGTTWTQAIVANLLFPDGLPDTLTRLSYWIEQRAAPVEDLYAILDNQTHRRFIKTHLPTDGLPLFANVKYIAVGRDGRDIGMSLWNHYSNYSDFTRERISQRLIEDGGDGSEFPIAPGDINTFWQNWTTRGWFEWQSDGWPFWSEFHIMQSWWALRDEPNVLLMHYHDMLSDLSGSIAEIADFLEIDVTAERLSEVTRATTFDEMKKNGTTYVPVGGKPWSGGAKTFFNQGTNGRWQHEISTQNLARYDRAAARALSPECRAWVEGGRAAL